MSTATDATTTAMLPDTDAAASDDLETVRLVNGLSCELPANSPLAKLLHSQRTWIGPDAKERLQDPQRGEVRRDRRRLAEPGALELLRRHLPAAVERLPALLREPERHRDPRPAGVREPRRPARGARHRRRCSAAAATSRRSSTRCSPSGAKTIWVQLGIWNQDAAYYGEEQGLTVVMDRCIKVEHARFHGGLHLLGFDTGQITCAQDGALSPRPTGRGHALRM